MCGSGAGQGSARGGEGRAEQAGQQPGFQLANSNEEIERLAGDVLRLTQEKEALAAGADSAPAAEDAPDLTALQAELQALRDNEAAAQASLSEATRLAAALQEAMDGRD